jgi:hypothetical protein
VLFERTESVISQATPPEEANDTFRSVIEVGIDIAQKNRDPLAESKWTVSMPSDFFGREVGVFKARGCPLCD